jgi:hypothetical protein
VPQYGYLKFKTSIIAGRFLWEQTRQEWTEIRSLRPKVKQVREPVLRYENKMTYKYTINPENFAITPFLSEVYYIKFMFQLAGHLVYFYSQFFSSDV